MSEVDGPFAVFDYAEVVFCAQITVSRERYDPVPADWSGEYVWQVTFHSQPYDIDIMTVPVGGASGLTGGSARSVEVGDEDNPITGTETHTDGLEINAVRDPRRLVPLCPCTPLYPCTHAPLYPCTPVPLSCASTRSAPARLNVYRASWCAHYRYN